VSKSNKNRDRRELVEQLRREAKAKERRRTLSVVAACLVVAAVIIGLAVYQVVKEDREAEQVRKAPLAEFGVSAAKASCDDIKEEDASGVNEHLDGQKVFYKTTPPSFGPHWSNPVGQLAGEGGVHMFTKESRPEVERLVHNLEHGWTIVWYSEQAAKDAATMEALEDLAAKLDADGQDPEANVIIAPWTSDDIGSFPKGKTIVLTHWSVHGKWDQSEAPSFGVTQACGDFSGAVLADFMEKYPYDDAPEGALWH
jgi:hypothetical protein